MTIFTGKIIQLRNTNKYHCHNCGHEAYLHTHYAIFQQDWHLAACWADCGCDQYELWPLNWYTETAQ